MPVLAWTVSSLAALAAPQAEVAVEGGLADGVAQMAPRGTVLGLAVRVGPSESFAVVARAHWGPGERSDFVTLDMREHPAFGAVPAIMSPITHACAVDLAFTPLRGEVEGLRARQWPIGLDLAVGMGAVRTDDHLWLYGGGPAALATEIQVHPMMEAAVGAWIEWPAMAGLTPVVRLDLRTMHYAETFDSTIVEAQHRSTASLAVGVRL